MTDSLGDRMKLYEGAPDQRLMPLLPICIRIDGRAFHTFTANMKRPYEERLSRLMIDVTKKLVEETGAVMGYTQSDEISLVLFQEDHKSQVYFDGRVQKLQSVVAALTTAIFNRMLIKAFEAKEIDDQLYPTFDCRAWSVPTKAEAANYLLWREQDATKNSVMMAARARFSHETVHGMKQNELKDLLFVNGVNWNEYPDFFKRGTFVQRKVQRRPFSASELDALPPKHHARQNPDLVVERTTTTELAMPPFGRVRNREQVIFEGAEPVLGAEEEPSSPPAAAMVVLLTEENSRLRVCLQAAVQAYMLGGATDHSWLEDAATLLDTATFLEAEIK